MVVSEKKQDVYLYRFCRIKRPWCSSHSFILLSLTKEPANLRHLYSSKVSHDFFHFFLFFLGGDGTFLKLSYDFNNRIIFCF